MKNLSQKLNLLLAVALVAMVVKMTVLDSTKTIHTGDETNQSNSTMESIFNRTSVRSYTPQKVEDEKIELLLRAAMAAPTAGNKQPWAFVVVDDRALLDSLAANLPYAKMVSQANVAIVVLGDVNKALLGADLDYWVQDCSAATENLLLAAHSLGLGAVWTGVFPREERVVVVRELLNTPTHLIPFAVIPIGYASGENTPKDKWNKENIYKNRF